MSKDSQMVEVLEDGTIHAFDLDVCDKEAEKAIKGLLKKHGKLFNFDFSASVFTLFVHCIYVLKWAGWTKEELLGELVAHYEEDDADTDEEDDD